MSNPLGSLVVRIGADFSDMKKAFKEANTSTVKLGRKMQSVGKTLTKSVTGPMLGVAAAIGALSLKTAAYADRVDKLSQRLGFSREAFQQWDYVLSQNGVNIESMQMGMKSLSQRMDEANRGVGEGSDLFERLGVSVTDASGKMKAQEDAFLETVRALQGMEEGVTKAALAQKLFGRNGQELLPMLNQTKGSVDDLMKKAKELGLVMGDDAVDAGVRFTDALDTLKRQFGAAAMEIGSAFLPLLEQVLLPMLRDHVLPAVMLLAGAVRTLIEAFTNLSKPVQTAILVIAGLVAGLGPLLVGLGSLLIILPKIKAALMAVNKSTIVLMAKIIAITAAVAAFAAAAYLIVKNWGQIAQFFRFLWKSVGRATTAAMDFVLATVQGAFLALIRKMAALGSKLLTPAIKVAEALGADDITAKLRRTQDAISNVVPESAVQNARDRARAAAGELDKAAGAIADSFRDAGASVREELAGAWAAARSGAAAFSSGLADLENSISDVTDASSGATPVLADIGTGLEDLADNASSAATSTREAIQEIGNIATIEKAVRDAGRAFRDRVLSALPDVAPPKLPEGTLEMATEYRVALEQIRNVVDGISYSIGDAVGELIEWRNPLTSLKEAALTLGRGLQQTFRQVVADITAAIAKALILKGIMSLLGSSTGGLGGFLSTALGGGSGAGKAGALSLNINVSGGEMRMGNGYLVAGVRAALAQEKRMGLPGTLQ